MFDSENITGPLFKGPVFIGIPQVTNSFKEVIGKHGCFGFFV